MTGASSGIRLPIAAAASGSLVSLDLHLRITERFFTEPVVHDVNESSGYIPAAGHHRFTKLYDPVVGLTLRERTVRREIRWRVGRDLPVGGVVVDVGCGTGSNAIPRSTLSARVIGVDPDDRALTLARAKEGASAVTWLEGQAQALPCDSASADAVVMCLLLHQLAQHLRPAGIRWA